MRKTTGLMLASGLAVVGTLALAQRPGDGPPQGADDLVTRMMSYDKNKDGKLTKDEVSDARLLRLFTRADADKDAVVTTAELKSLAAREQDDERNGPAGGPGFGPPGGGPPRGGPGGFMGGGPPRPGTILPPPLQQFLNLTADQKAQVEQLQKEVDAKLDKILNDDQKKQLKEMRSRGPGRGGPPGGRGPGGFGPPGGGDGPPPGGPGGGRPPE